LPLQDNQLVAMNYRLNVPAQIIGGAGEEPDQAAQQ
jgi:hypothetical protein